MKRLKKSFYEHENFCNEIGRLLSNLFFPRFASPKRMTYKTRMHNEATSALNKRFFDFGCLLPICHLRGKVA